MDKRIFSGDNSRDFWKEIRNIDSLSNMDDIHNVLYSAGCLCQQLEDRMAKLTIRIAVIETSLTNTNE